MNARTRGQKAGKKCLKAHPQLRKDEYEQLGVDVARATYTSKSGSSRHARVAFYTAWAEQWKK